MKIVKMTTNNEDCENGNNTMNKSENGDNIMNKSDNDYKNMQIVKMTTQNMKSVKMTTSFMWRPREAMGIPGILGGHGNTFSLLKQVLCGGHGNTGNTARPLHF